MDKPELNADDLMKGIEDMMKGATTSKASPIEVTDPEQFLPHERMIAKDLWALSQMLALGKNEMLLSLKRIIYFIEHYKVKDDSR